MNLEDCYRMLELKPGASPEEIKRAYREMVKVWHPDRFSNDPVLQAKAQEKLKQINAAYEKILDGPISAPRNRNDEPPPAPAPQTGGGGAGRGGGKSHSWSFRWEYGTAPKQSTSRMRVEPRLKMRRILLGFALVFVVALVAFYVAVERLHKGGGRTAGIQPTGEKETPVTADRPPQDTQAPLANGIVPTNPVVSTPPETAVSSAPGEYFTIGSTREEVVAIQGRPASLSDNLYRYGTSLVAFENDRVKSWRGGFPKLKTRLLPSNPTKAAAFFTVGSTRDEVLAAQGSPTSVSDDELEYDSSVVTFENGKVKSWRTGYVKLRAQLVPPAGMERENFTLGSTRDEVVAAQGSPTSFSDTEFLYESSMVGFENGRVKSWSEGSMKLKTLLLPKSRAGVKDYFTVGSTRDEVLALQGSPTSVSDSEFVYRMSAVSFKDGRVVSWRDGFPKLRAQLLPSVPIEAREYFTIGSTKDEVLAVQGTPTSFSEQMFNYGTSSVSFENGRVKGWHDGFPSLKAR